MRLPVLALLSLFVLTGCATLDTRSYNYDSALVEVERPSDPSNRYSEQITTDQTEDGSSRYLYADSLMSIAWVPGNTQIAFVLENKTDHSLKVLWDEAAFLSPSGSSSRLMHEGIRYMEREASMPASIVPRRGRLVDFVVPTDNVYYVSGRYGGWRTSPLMSPGSPSRGTIEEAQTNVGQRFSVLLPIEVQGETNEYMFTFEVTAASAP